MSAELPVLILGAGGHGRVVASVFLAMGRTVLGFTDGDAALHGTTVLGLPVLGGDDVAEGHTPGTIALAVGVGSTRSTRVRRALFERLSAQGHRFAAAVHPAAIVAPDVQIAAGAQIMAGAVIQTGTRVGANVIVNTAAAIDHDCVLEPHCHIAPGAVLCGAAVVTTGAHVGSGATVIQGICIGADAVVGAGAVVLRDVPAGYVVAGNPARELGK